MPARRASPPPSADEVAHRLHAAAIHLLRHLRRQDEGMGLTAPRASALSVLVFGGPRTLGQLAAAEQVRPPTMTRLVAALEADGLVVREGDPDDARRVRMRATPRGRALLHKGRARRVEVLARRVLALPDRERALLARAADLVERLAAPDEEP